MERLPITIREATEAWVRTFITIPTITLERLVLYNETEMREVTPPITGNRVQITDGPHKGCLGEILSRDPCATGEYIIRLDDQLDTAIIQGHDIKILHVGDLPTWYEMWAFRRSADIDWIAGLIDPDALYKAASCGIRIYEQDDFEYVLGIDSEGCDFFETHWVPLYMARGLHWHDDD